MPSHDPRHDKVAQQQLEYEERRDERRRVRDASSLDDLVSYQNVPSVKVVESKKGNLSLKFDGDTYTKGLMHWMFPGLPLVNIPMRNALPEENGKQKPVPSRVYLALLGVGLVSFATKSGAHLIPMQSMSIVRSMFGKMADAASYFRSLLAATKGTKGVIRNQRCMVDTVMADYPDGTRRPRGSDGAGLIHPKHPLYAQLGISPDDACKLQIRATESKLRELVNEVIATLRSKRRWDWSLFARMVKVMLVDEDMAFIKGTVDPSEEALDRHGNPTIIWDYLQIKGNKKKKAKTSRKNGAKPGFVHCDIAVLDIFRTRGKCSLCFEFWELIKARHSDGSRHLENEARAKRVQAREWAKWSRKGGMLGSVRQLSEDNRLVRLAIKLAKKLTISVLSIPLVRQLATEHMNQWIWFVHQGGKKLDYIGISIANNVPPGHVLLKCPVDSEGNKLYGHGDDILSTRLPLVLPQGIQILKIIDMESEEGREEFPHLMSLLIHRNGKLAMPDNLAFQNERTCFAQNADDDGDRNMYSTDKDLLALAREKRHIFEPDELIMIEPDVVEGAARSEIKLNTWPGLRGVGFDFQGPVGYFTTLKSAMIDLGYLGWELALALAIQVSIDSGKKVMVTPNLYHAFNLRNWVKCTETDYWGTYEVYRLPTNSPTYAANSSSLDPVTGCWNMDWVFKFGAKRLGSTYENPVRVEDVCTWRAQRSWNSFARGPAEGLGKGTLLTVMAENTSTLMEQYSDELKIPEAETIDMGFLLSDALGVPRMDPLPRDSAEFKDLVAKSGLHDYGKAVHDILRAGYDDKKRNEMIEAQVSLLSGELMSVGTASNLLLWTSCLHGLDHSNPVNKKYLNWAFLAISYEGSQILDLLEITPDEDGCTFLLEHQQQLVEFVQNEYERPNGKRTIGEAAVEFLHSSELNAVHQEAHQETMAECRHCKEHVRSVVTTMVRKKADPMHKDFVASRVTRANALIWAMATEPSTRQELRAAIAESCSKMHAGKGIPVFEVSEGWISTAFPNIKD